MKDQRKIQIKKHKDGRMFLYVNGTLKTIDSRPSMILATLDTLGYKLPLTTEKS